MWTIIIFFLKLTQFFHISKAYFTFLTEGYIFKMANIMNSCVMLVPKCKKIAGIIFHKRLKKMCVLASIKFCGRPNIHKIHEIHETLFSQKQVALLY